METLPDGCCDLIYIDPPFFTGKTQTQRNNQANFPDTWPEGIEGYLDFMQPRLIQMHRLLKPTGTIYVHLDWHASHYVKVLLDEIIGYNNFLNEIIWSYRTGGQSKKWFARKHDTILVYAKNMGQHNFHLQREGTFRTDGMKYDDQGKPYKQTLKGRLYFNPNGPAVTDVWDIPFLSTVATERTGWPTQKPEKLLERIVRASSNPGDTVADFFCGSGTALVVAARLDRVPLGCDCSPQAIAITRQRITNTQPD